jgi:uncharacterized protein (DUF2336 family)
MHLNTHNHAQPVTPLLVQLYDTHRLYKLAGDNAPEARHELCEIVSGLLASSVKASEKELIADILISLIRQAEYDLKAALSQRLSTLDDVPLRLVLRLAEEEIGIAEPVLRYSKVLNDFDLIYLIQSHDAAYWQAIARRDGLSEPISEKLAETRDLKTAEILAGNETAHLNDVACGILTELACQNDGVARSLLHRAELPVEVAQRIYQYVAADLKAFIETEFNLKSAEIQENIADVVSEFTNSTESGFKPSSSAIKAAAVIAERGQLTVPMMISTLKRGQVSSYVAQFSRYCEIPMPVVMSMLQQPQGQGLAIACRLMEIGRDDFISMFLLTRRMVRHDGIVDHRDLNKAITYYNRISKELAERLLRPRR